MPVDLQFRQHYISGGSSSYGATADTSFFLRADGVGSQIAAWMVFRRAWLHGKKVRYTRTTAGNSGSAHKWIYVEIMDGGYIRSSSTHFPVAASRINLGAGRLVLIENEYGRTTSLTMTTGILDLSSGVLDDVSLCFRVEGWYSGRYWLLTVTSVEILDADDNVVATLDINNVDVEDTTSGQHYGTMGVLPVDFFQPVAAGLVGEYGLYAALLEQALVGEYHFLSAISPAGLVGRYSMLLEQGLIGRYQDAAIILAGLVGRYQDAPQVLAGLVGRYGDMVPVLAALVGRYHLMHDVLAGLDGRYAIAGEAVLAGLVGHYDLRDRNEVLAGLLGYYSLMADAQVVQPACKVLIGGAAVRWSQVSWTETEDSYLIEATIVLRDPAEHRAIAKQDQVLLTWMGTTYTLYVAALLRSRSVSGSPGDAGYSADYVVVARSLTAGLDAPHALPITREWPEATLASQIAADLVAGLADIISLDFRLEDWLQPGGTFFVTDEPPLAGLAKLAGLIGGVLQTAPDNTLILRMQDVISPAQWAETTPAWTIEDSGLFSDSESEAESNRYNVVTVTNQSESTEAIRFEGEDLTPQRKRVKGYRVPWALFDLATSGGPWVTIEAEGVVEEQITEVVEIVDGSGQASKPIYSQVAATWLQTSLGAITGAEDGSLTAAVPGCSLAEITYTTRYMAWIGASPRDEEVQFYQVEIMP